MPITIDIKENTFYKEGIEKGIKEGMRLSIINLYKDLQLPIKQIAIGLKVDVEYIKSILIEEGII